MNDTTQAAESIDRLNASFLKVAEAFKNSAKSAAAFSAVFDNLTKSHTAFADFYEMLTAKGGYFPSLPRSIAETDSSANPGLQSALMELVTLSDGRKITSELYYAELDLLALAYDMAQAARGDNRRAFRS